MVFLSRNSQTCRDARTGRKAGEFSPVARALVLMFQARGEDQEPMRLKDIGGTLGVSYQEVRNNMTLPMRHGYITQPAYGKYAWTGKAMPEQAVKPLEQLRRRWGLVRAQMERAKRRGLVGVGENAKSTTLGGDTP